MFGVTISVPNELVVPQPSVKRHTASRPPEAANGLLEYGLLESGSPSSYLSSGNPPLLRELMSENKRARAVGFNHIALEVGDIEEALSFYSRLFDFELRGKSEEAAFIDLGDKFLALETGSTQPGDDGRDFGLVVDDQEAVRQALAEAGIE